MCVTTICVVVLGLLASVLYLTRKKKGRRTLAPFVQTEDVFRPRVYQSASAMSRGVFQQPVPTSTSAMTVASFRRY